MNKIRIICLILTFSVCGYASDSTSLKDEIDEASIVLVGKVVECKNPNILAKLNFVGDIDLGDYYEREKKLPVDFQKIKLGPKCFGYRSDFLAGGQGTTGYQRAWIFELKNDSLFEVGDFKGSYLFTDDSLAYDGKYKLWQFHGDINENPDVLTKNRINYIYKNGKFEKE